MQAASLCRFPAKEPNRAPQSGLHRSTITSVAVNFYKDSKTVNLKNIII